MVYKFIHFGCWNNGSCPSENNGLSKTMELLNKTVSEDKGYDFISVAGDNYYTKKYKPSEITRDKCNFQNLSPDEIGIGGKKEKKKDKEGKEKKEIKEFNPFNFKNGFDCLPNEPKKVVIYGNHDIEDAFGEENKKCLLIEQQVLYVESNPKKNIILFDNVIFNYINGGTLIIFIDTTLYGLDSTTKIENSCYKEIDDYRIFNNVDKSGTVKDLINYQNKKIMEIISMFINNKFDKLTNLIVIGHEPIISVKFKSETDGNKTSSLKGLIELFSNIIEIVKHNQTNIYYLCADTHIYQSGVIEINNYNVKQYIVGTGGTSLDECSRINTTEQNGVKYTIDKQINNHGFIIVNCWDNKDIEIIFNKIPETPKIPEILENSKSFETKYLKYKAKYLSLKKN